MPISTVGSVLKLDENFLCKNTQIISQGDHVVILMCTYNGGRFLNEQLKSFDQQDHGDWSLVVSDDGSQDESLSILQLYAEGLDSSRVKVVEGPQRGFAENFLSLTAREDIQAKFYAWADQDDIWRKDKLQAAVAWLKTIPEHIPALYCGRTELISESGVTTGYSPRFRLPPGFSNALVQNIAGGNTMVFNQAARKLLQEAGHTLLVPAHDWWAYQLISGVGGVVYYDPEPRVRYRQHSANVVGSNSNWLARVQRLRMVFQGRFSEWNTQNIRVLESMKHRLSEGNKVKLAKFKGMRDNGLFYRLLSIRQAGLYRQTLLGNLGLLLAVLLKKI